MERLRKKFDVQVQDRANFVNMSSQATIPWHIPWHIPSTSIHNGCLGFLDLILCQEMLNLDTELSLGHYFIYRFSIRPNLLTEQRVRDGILTRSLERCSFKRLSLAQVERLLDSWQLAHGSIIEQRLLVDQVIQMMWFHPGSNRACRKFTTSLREALPQRQPSWVDCAKPCRTKFNRGFSFY